MRYRELNVAGLNEGRGVLAEDISPSLPRVEAPAEGKPYRAFHTVRSGRMPEAKPSKATDALDELARVTRSTSRERLVLIDRSGRTLFRLDYEPGNVDAKKAADLHQESLGEVKADLPEAVAHQAFDPPWAGEEPQRLPWSHRAENFPVPVHAHGQLGQRQTTFLS